jgi:hypothetical protein
MSCSTLLVVEYNDDNSLVDWRLHCSGDCPDGKKCKPVSHGPENIGDGWERTIHECACKREGDEPTRRICIYFVTISVSVLMRSSRSPDISALPLSLRSLQVMRKEQVS